MHFLTMNIDENCSTLLANLIRQLFPFFYQGSSKFSWHSLFNFVDRLCEKHGVTVKMTVCPKVFGRPSKKAIFASIKISETWERFDGYIYISSSSSSSSLLIIFLFIYLCIYFYLIISFVRNTVRMLRPSLLFLKYYTPACFPLYEIGWEY